MLATDIYFNLLMVSVRLSNSGLRVERGSSPFAPIVRPLLSLAVVILKADISTEIKAP
jgi:hypothetical protein